LSNSNEARVVWSCVTAAAIIGLVAVYIAIVMSLDIDVVGMVGLNFCSVLVSLLLAENFQRRKKIDWWAVPLGWLSGLIPIAVFSYHIDKASGFFGPDFTMLVFSIFLLPAPFCASLIIAAIYARIVKRAEEAEDKGGEKTL